MRRFLSASLALVTAVLLSIPRQDASAHFIWLAPQASGEQAESLEIYFSESATPDNPRLLDLLGTLQLWHVPVDGQPQALQPQRDGDSLAAKLPVEGAPGVLVASQDFGARDKRGEKYRLMYYAKSGPSLDSRLWQQVDTSDLLTLDIRPRQVGGQVELVVQFGGSPAAEADVKILGPDDSDGEDFDGQTGADGKYRFTVTTAGRYSIRARHIEPTSGKVDDQAYDDVRHYTTLTLDVPDAAVTLSSKRLGELPMTLTSFGGAVLGDQVYIYGGTMGQSHSYSSDVQNDALMRMPIGGGQWETVARGPRLQGLAMVAHGGKLYRLGGFEARNEAGEEHDLWSSDAVAAFDPQVGQWSEMPALPEPRSSFDAVVMGDFVYVVGGWAMAGDARRQWHETAWKLDLTAETPAWQAIANTPLERRALALAAHDGRLYAIGGITSGGETVLETDIYDPATDRWAEGPELVGDSGMTGFGASAFATGGRLYITTVAGNLQRLSDDGSAWEVVAQTPTPRFFHRMLPVSDDAFVVVGGSNRQGRVTEVELLMLR